MHSVVWIYCRPSPFITAPQDTVSLSNLLYVFIGKRREKTCKGRQDVYALEYLLVEDGLLQSIKEQTDSFILGLFPNTFTQEF